MIQLQRFWDGVLLARDEIARAGKSIDFWKKQVADTEKSLALLESRIKTMKSAIKQKEIELSQKDEKSTKLEARKTAVKNERELAALESEKHTLDGERTALEEKVLMEMEELDGASAEEKRLSGELDGMKVQAEKDILMLQGRIAENRKAMEENQAAYDALLVELTPPFRAKFHKLTESAGGKAIVRLDGETCEGCRFQIPLNFVLDAAKSDRVVNCTHCGRFIYKP